MQYPSPVHNYVVEHFRKQISQEIKKMKFYKKKRERDRRLLTFIHLTIEKKVTLYLA